ncbi:MAG: hypothetical protein PVH74_18145 [Desulfobacterales bacterium]|jgi:hypothetical protein
MEKRIVTYAAAPWIGCSYEHPQRIRRTAQNDSWPHRVAVPVLKMRCRK